MLEKLKEINRINSIEKTSKVLILIVIFHLLRVFAVYYETKLHLSNPLIPKYLAFEIFNPYAEKGFILTLGLLFAITLKFFKQNFIVMVVCFVIIIFYHLTTFKPNFTEYIK